MKRFALILSAIVLVGGCGSDDGAADAAPGDAGVDGLATDASAESSAPGTDAEAADAGPELPDLEPGWNVVYPGGDTVCSRGDKYVFAVHPGKVNKLVVDFEGGGACWTKETCALATAIFKERAEDSLKYIDDGYSEGIYDRDNPDNPFKDWYHVFVPYCTGDIHWGDAVHTYGEGPGAVTINHRGAVNARAVLEWIGERFGAPETIFVTGCSAGSYGSLMWASHLIKRYPQARVYQLGDSGAGVVTDTFLADSFPNWNAFGAAPDWIPALDPSKVDLESKDIAYLYAAAANGNPSHTFSQFNKLLDENQIFYFNAMGGGTAAEWSAAMVESVDRIIGEAPTFRAFLTEGEEHCVLPYDRFYTTEVDGRRLTDWIADLVAGKPVKNQRCAACVPTP